MRNRQLRAALAAFAEEAAWQLASETAEGAEVPFEVIESGSRRDTPLYCYRPLTASFIAARTGVLSRLPSYLPALHALTRLGRLDAYLDRRGEPAPREPRERADAALSAFLGRVFEDSTDFVLAPERLQRALDELEELTAENRTDNVAIAPILGLEIAGEHVELGEGLALAIGESLGDEAPPEATWSRASGRAHVLAVLRWEDAPGDASPASHARVRLRRLLTALRLFDPAGLGCGSLAWMRTGGGAWHPFALGAAVAPARTVTIVPEQEDELRAFVSLVSRRTPRSGELAWSLRRFELACERVQPAEALSDALLALRALLEPEGPGSGRLGGRVAALCALPDERVELTERVARTVAQERAVIAGLALDPELDVLVEELLGHLRALLRDVLCGHLDPDLRTLADSILAQSSLSDQPTAA